ncbi:rho GTPase-activating protein 33 isoform X2 [Megalops cyprinoides]|uniref:rho GTPase-activating protein 33 isoform X2 n=1 Tax=Megalops cyprinoides TaxID=118141 RepID=UPI0018656724|nr:rho GTPase-activating protein 33 isoform X2 [Megalops cyprinoides]
MQRRVTVSGPQWVRKCAMFVRAVSLTDMPGNFPFSMQLALRARSTDNLDSSGDSATRSAGSTSNPRGKMSKRVSVGRGHFPKLADCAHFHYENVDFGSIELQLASEQSEGHWNSGSAKDLVFLVQVSCQGKVWMVRRSYEEFRTLDAHLHQCIYDRRYSQLLPLPALSEIGERPEVFHPLLSEYLSRLSMIVDNKLNCGPVLTWMEIDNRGNRFLLKEEASLNVPAIAAAHVIKRYTAQASDEISIEVGDILSVIDMPPKEDSSWWRGKHGFQVGFFPSECVELINERVGASTAKPDGDAVSSKAGVVSVAGPPSPTSVSKKHGKLMGFLRTFMKSRPSKQKLKQRGILRERVFGCDLGEHLLNSGQDVPQVLRSCAEFIEKYGIVDGIYRHSGVSSNIQKLRHEFDSENVPDLTKEVYMQDIHCVGSLCKLYFRELPNPLLTYQLYDKFADCMGEMTEEERMVKVHDVIQQLPPPHYRTLEYLMRHLARLATCSGETNMHIKNLAIVWAPNLLRSMEIEAVGLSGADPFKEVRIQSVVVEFLLSNVDVLFSDSFTSVGRFNTGRRSLARPKSFVSTRLLSLEEAQARTQAPLLLQGAPLGLQGRFHTVLDLPADRRKRGLKGRRSAGGSWKTFFAIGKPAGSGRRKPMRISSLFQPATSHAGCRVDSVTLRSAKSEESLTSQHSAAGVGRLQRLRRPRSSSDGLALAASMEPPLPPPPHPGLPPSRSYDSLLPEEARDPEGEDEEGDEEEEEEEEEEGVYMLPDFSQDAAAAWMAEDVIDFSPTFLEDGPIGLGGALGGGRESPPAATPPPYRCVGHQSHAHSRSHSQRSVTEDPDSVLNQSEAAARRSLILAATAPPLQAFCQHRPPAAPPMQGGDPGSPAHGSPATPPERCSFTRKVVHALSPKAPKSPPLDISDPIAISVPAKVLEMIGGRAGELPPGPQGAGHSHPPQMISMLLRSCDFQLTDSCQQELRSKLGPEAKVKGQGLILSAGPSVSSQQPPPPPPKNPARLMALALAESANKALRQAASPPYRPPQTTGPQVTPLQATPSQATPPEPIESRFMRSLSMDTGQVLSSASPTDPNQLYSTVRPLSVWMSEGEKNSTDAAEEGERQSGRNQGQDTGTLSSDTSVSESGGSVGGSAGSSSGETDAAPSPIYKNQEQPAVPACPAAETEAVKPDAPHAGGGEATPLRKPPAYSRQVSAPQSRTPATPPLLHSRSESSPLAQVRAFQPARPKVPPKPLELAAHRPPLSRADNHMRRSLDAARIRRIITQSQDSAPNAPLSRAFSERLSSSSAMSHYHPPRPGLRPNPLPQPPPPQAQPAPLDEQGKMENFYYEITAPEYPPAPPGYARHSYQNLRLDAEGNLRPLARGPAPTRPAQLWSSEATRAWAAAHAHSHSHSFSHAHSHAPPREVPLQRRTASSVRLTPSTPPPGSAPLALSVHRLSLRGPPRGPPRCPSADLAASQLHPYFENGKVCYRYFEDQPLKLRPSGLAPHPHKHPPFSPSPAPAQKPPEPVYVNFPFTSPTPVSARTWASTDLDGDAQQAESLAPPPEPPPPEKQAAEGSRGSDSAGYDGRPQDSPVTKATTAVGVAHTRSRSDPQSQSLTGKEIASLLMEKLAEDEADSPCAITSSSTSSSPPLDHPPNPYPSHGPAYNVYTPGPSRQDPLRRSSSGGQYRQAFDVMPSGDQVLKFYRLQGDSPHSNPYPNQSPYPDGPYPGHSPVEPHPGYSALSPPGAPQPPVSHVTLGAAQGFGAPAGGFQSVAPQYNQYQFQPVPVMAPYPSPPHPPGLPSQQALTRQGSLPGPNWTIHSKGQTRSYC